MTLKIYISTFCIAVGYVAILYLLPRSIRVLPRDNPTHIKYRCMVTTVYTLLCWILLWTCTNSSDYNFLDIASFSSDWSNLGINFLFGITCILCLYFGHIIGKCFQFLEYPQLEEWKIVNNCMSLQFARDLVIAPISEEIVYRGFILFLLRSLGGLSWLSTALVGSSAFAVAHLHHIQNHINMGNTVVKAILMSALQLAYTCLFGAIAWRIMFICGDLSAAIGAHMACNSLGLPDISRMNPQYNKWNTHWYVRACYAFGIGAFISMLY